MYRDKHFTDYARKVAAADADRTIDGPEAPGLPETPDFDAIRQGGAPQQQLELFGTEGWLGNDAPYLDQERRNRDYGGYRPAIGKYADPAEHGSQWQGKAPPPGDTPKP